MKDPLEETGEVDRRGASVVLVGAILVLIAVAITRPGARDALAIVAGLVLLIMLHEAGHYVAAKRSGMKVTEYFLGFGPRLWSFRRGETEYGVKAIPLGGYVRIVGMTNLEAVDPEDEPRTYRQASYGRRLITVLAGVGVNFALALVLFFAVLVGRGMAEGPSTTISTIVGDSAASAAGLRSGDHIVAVGGREISGWDQLKGAIETRGDVPTVFTVVRDGRRIEVEATPGSRDGKGFLGVGPATKFERVGALDAVPQSFEVMGGLIARTGEAVGDLFSPSGVESYSKHFGSDAPEAGSPAAQNRLVSIVGIVDQGSRIVDGNLWTLLALLGALNVAVALINLVPLPPFDGGHAMVVVYEWVASKIKRRPVRADYRKLMPVTMVVLAIFLTLSVSAMFLDIRDALGS